MKRAHVLIAAVPLAAMLASEPVAAFRGRTHPRGQFAVRSVGYHHHGGRGRHGRYGGTALTGSTDGVEAGVGGQPLPGGRAAPNYSHGDSCRNSGFDYSCPYYELPNWNGPAVIMNPGGG